MKTIKNTVVPSIKKLIKSDSEINELVLNFKYNLIEKNEYLKSIIESIEIGRYKDLLNHEPKLWESLYLYKPEHLREYLRKEYEQFEKDSKIYEKEKLFIEVQKNMYNYMDPNSKERRELLEKMDSEDLKIINSMISRTVEEPEMQQFIQSMLNKKLIYPLVNFILKDLKVPKYRKKWESGECSSVYKYLERRF